MFGWDGELPQPSVRTTEEMRSVLASPACERSGPLYYMYRDLAKSDEDWSWLHRQELRYDITVSDLSGPVLAAHLHNAPAGVNAAAVFGIDLSTNLEFLRGIMKWFLHRDPWAKPTTKFVVPYLLGGVVLGESQRHGRAAVALLERGRAEFPADWRFPFYIGAIPGFLLAIAVMFLREPERGQFDSLKETPERGTILGLARNPAFLTATLGMAMMTYSLGGIQVWMPQFLYSDRGYSLEKANLIFGAIVVVDGVLADGHPHGISGGSGEGRSPRQRLAVRSQSGAGKLPAGNQCDVALHRFGPRGRVNPGECAAVASIQGRAHAFFVRPRDPELVLALCGPQVVVFRRRHDEPARPR